MRLRTFLRAKIHRARVTSADLHYVGSITIDAELLAAAGIAEYEFVQVVDIDNGARLETYVIAGEPGSGVIQLNGAAARLVQVGDLVIVMSYELTDEPQATAAPVVILVDPATNTVAGRLPRSAGAAGGPT